MRPVERHRNLRQLVCERFPIYAGQCSAISIPGWQPLKLDEADSGPQLVQPKVVPALDDIVTNTPPAIPVQRACCHSVRAEEARPGTAPVVGHQNHAALGSRHVLVREEAERGGIAVDSDDASEATGVGGIFEEVKTELVGKRAPS